MTKATSPYLNRPPRTREEAMSETNVYNIFDHRAPLADTRRCDVGDYEAEAFDPQPDPVHDEKQRRAEINSPIKLALLCCAIIFAIAIIGSMVP